MGYYINPAALKSIVPIPSEAIQNNLKLASLIQLKVLLYCFCDTSRQISPDGISKELSLPLDEVEDALTFWEQKCVLLSDTFSPAAAPQKPKASEKPHPDVLPTREDVARRGNEDDKIKLLLREAQLKFGRGLKSNESSILVWLYDDKGLDISILLLIIQYAASTDNLRINFIEKVALDWIEKGVSTLTEAEEQIAIAARDELCWKIVRSAFAIDRRLPGKREQEFATVWVNDWGFSGELLREAYKICTDNTAKISFKYIDGILRSWHSEGIKTLKDVTLAAEKKQQAAKATCGDGYDLSAFENMLNED